MDTSIGNEVMTQLTKCFSGVTVVFFKIIKLFLLAAMFSNQQHCSVTLRYISLLLFRSHCNAQPYNWECRGNNQMQIYSLRLSNTGKSDSFLQMRPEQKKQFTYSLPQVFLKDPAGHFTWFVVNNNHQTNKQKKTDNTAVYHCFQFSLYKLRCS